MKQANVITAAEAAKEKSCAVRTIYWAADHGHLNDTRIGSARLIFKDKKYQAWQPSNVGLRARNQSEE